MWQGRQRVTPTYCAKAAVDSTTSPPTPKPSFPMRSKSFISHLETDWIFPGGLTGQVKGDTHTQTQFSNEFASLLASGQLSPFCLTTYVCVCTGTLPFPKQ